MAFGFLFFVLKNCIRQLH